jgi:pimeloyl-ACP methyl ester carboxylesterase
MSFEGFDRLSPGERCPIVLIHGAGHERAHWEPLQSQLYMLGHPTISPELPTEDIQATHADDARTIVEAVDRQSFDKFFVVAHSRGVEAAVRLPVERIIGMTFLCSGGPHDLQVAPAYAGGPELPRYSEAYANSFRMVSERLSEFDPAAAKNLFYKEVGERFGEEAVRVAVELLRPQRVPQPGEAPLPTLPFAFPLYYVLGEQDPLHNKIRAQRVAEEHFGVKAVEIEQWGHTPQLSHPQELGRLLAAQAVEAQMYQA